MTAGRGAEAAEFRRVMEFLAADPDGWTGPAGDNFVSLMQRVFARMIAGRDRGPRGGSLLVDPADARCADGRGDPAHRSEEAGLAEPVPEEPAGVLHSSVHVNHGSRFGAPPPAGHLKRVDDDLGSDPVADRPADDAAAERVDDGGAVDPSVSRAMLCDVAEPEPVGRVSAELPLHGVLVSGGVGRPAAPLPAVRDSGQPAQPYQPRAACLRLT